MARPCPAPLPLPRSGMPRANQRRCGRGDASPVPAAGVAGAAGTPNCWFFARHPSGLAGNVLKFSFFFSRFLLSFPAHAGAVPSLPCQELLLRGWKLGRPHRSRPLCPAAPLPSAPSLKPGDFGAFFPQLHPPGWLCRRAGGPRGGFALCRGGSGQAQPVESVKLRATEHPFPPTLSCFCSSQRAGPGCSAPETQEKPQRGAPGGT